MTSVVTKIFRQAAQVLRTLTVPGRSSLADMPSRKQIEKEINSKKVVVYSKSWCSYCLKAKKALANLDGLSEKDILIIELDRLEGGDGSAIQDIMQELTGGRSVPRVFINGKFFGGGDETSAGAKNGTLAKKLANEGN